MVAETTMRRGRCNNVGMCENAVFQRPITVPEGEPFVCPQCLGELTDVRDRKTARKPSQVVVPLVALCLAVAVAGYAAWRQYGAPHAAAPPLSQASLAPAVPIGAGPAPASPATAGDPAPAVPAGTQTKMMASSGSSGSPAAPASAAPASPALDTPAGPAVASSAAAPASPSTGAPPASVHAETAPASGSVAAAPGPVTPQSPPQPPAAAAPVGGPMPGTATALAAPPAAEPAATPSGAAAQAEAGPAPAGAVQAAPQAVRDFLGEAKPVPVAFHFKPNSALLNSHGDRDVAHLVAYLAAHHASGAQLYLAGFTDNLGSSAGNLEFARRRVATVVAALAAAGVKPAHVASFGAEMPVADNATARGREENRRVEVYLGQ